MQKSELKKYMFMQFVKEDEKKKEKKKKEKKENKGKFKMGFCDISFWKIVHIYRDTIRTRCTR